VTNRPTRSNVRFALPASLGPDSQQRAVQLQAHLAQALGREVEVNVAATYEQLARELLSGKVDAAWAPPFVCARIEAMGVRVLVRGVRGGASVYRAALLTKANSNVTLETLKGTTAAWSDRDSVGGYLLPMAWLREKGLDPARTFHQQDFSGNYRAALEAVFSGKADVTSVFAPAGEGHETGAAEVWPEQKDGFRVLGFTEEAPNDGVAVAMGVSPALVTELEKVLLSMQQSAGGAAMLKDCFHADKFELAPRMGYRALYRVALASL
jgi:phosphonate transport system substrate-binding protein